MQEQMLKDKFISGLPLKLREKVKFNTFDDLIKAAIKYDVALQEIEDEKRQIDIVSLIAECTRQNESKTNSEVTDAIKQLEEQTKELVCELKGTKKPFNARLPRESEGQPNDTPSYPKERRDGQRRPPQHFNYTPQPAFYNPITLFRWFLIN